MTSISVIVATYNGQEFIEQQLDSILNQTKHPAELIVSDDNSTDNTLEMVRQFAGRAPFPVRIYRNEHRLGYRANFMAALALCESELIAFCDQDDIWDARKLSVASVAFDNPEVLLFFHNAWLIDKSGSRIGPANIFLAPPESPALSSHSLTSPYGFSMVFRRDLKQFSNLWNRSLMSGEPGKPMSHDQWIYFLASIFGTIICSNAYLADYRQHGRNVVGYAYKRTLRSRIGRCLRLITNDTNYYRLLSDAARARAEILTESRTSLDEVWAERAVLGERGCARLAERLAIRAEVYGAPSFLKRMRLVAWLFRNQAYMDDKGWGLGRCAFYKDIAFGIFLQPFLLSSITFESLRHRRPKV